jgi:hypothetical protein
MRPLTTTAATALCLALLAAPALVRAESVTYPWHPQSAADDLERRFVPPPGAQRVAAPPRSFAAFLRRLPLLPPGSPVRLFDGQLKHRQDVHAAVIDLDVGARDLQQCADAAMRLRAEFLYSLGRYGDIRFHPAPGKKTVLAYSGGADRAHFSRYLTQVFSAAGSASLEAELPRRTGPVEPGDLLSQGGHPGHVVIVLDVAEGAGRRYLLIGQSFMPAQQFHVVRNLQDAALSPWYDESALDKGGLKTPEWTPFLRSQVHKFE